MKNKSSVPAVSKGEYASQNAWGLLAVINLYDCDPKLIKNPKAIKKFIIELCRIIKMKRWGECQVEQLGKGHLEGYSAFQFIETSTIIAHFDDKTGNRAFIDVFSCKYFDQAKAAKFCQKYFKAKSSKFQSIIRG